ncbi:hypothetical protein CYMTET_28306 [Cymbomonas tetramitiformis]|uniref:UDP-N-acetylglucosamine 1-carboxyvinyltransferase n=1 Tax=Cymbomonas tetramitiformis TaxID=36881 RepID=A0AAE0KW18_9CHLO|nr:hypothetical protein CYMTET_28306 [Cymbomonas tetramitiformis]
MVIQHRYKSPSGKVQQAQQLENLYAKCPLFRARNPSILSSRQRLPPRWKPANCRKYTLPSANVKCRACADSRFSSTSPSKHSHKPNNEENFLSERTMLQIHGGKRLEGEVKVSGAKNAALAIQAGCLLCEQPMVLHNVPDLVDVANMGEVLQSVGASVERDGHDSNSLVLNCSELTSSSPSLESVVKLRASFLVIGPLLARNGETSVPLPGGCAIGARPVNLHIRGLEALGAKVEVKDGVVHATVGPEGTLRGSRVYLEYPSVGATETVIMAAVVAEGETVIENVAQEPEIVDLANFLVSVGARIRGAGTKVITIQGVRSLHGGEYTVIPDRVEAGTLLVSAAITYSNLWLSSIVPAHLTSIVTKLEETGCQIKFKDDNRLELIPPPELLSTDIRTLPYPGFPTDMQAQFMALLTVAKGPSVVQETVFEGRMAHALELQQMGARLSVAESTAFLEGIQEDHGGLQGASVAGSDLRGTAALVLAGLAAEGITKVQGLQHLDRGYDKLDQKLRSIGASVERISMDNAKD